VDDFIWSFSRIQSFDQCPYGWKMRYLEERMGTPNAYAQYGSFVHSILEKYFKGKLNIFELSGYYIENFKEYVTEDFPKHKYVDLAKSYFDKGLEYFNRFDGLEQYKILGIEEKIKINIDGYNFTGYIDLLAENEDGGIEVIDHKSRDLKERSGKGKVTKSDMELDEYLRQLYLYSIAVFEKYEIYPKYLNFNVFRSNVWIREPFDFHKLCDSKRWFIDTIHNIEKETEFKPKPDKFFCRHLCDFRHECEPFLGR
jgi:hypothetical protein